MQVKLSDAKRLIDLSANPLDLRPAVEAAVGEILEVRNSTPADQSVIVAVSELHDIAAQVIFRLLLVNELRKAFGVAALPAPDAAANDNRPRHGVAYAEEFAHNALEWALAYKYKGSLPLHWRGISSANDPTGAYSLQALIEADFHMFAPVSRDMMSRYWLRHKIPCRFTDTARLYKNGHSYLDNSDPRTAEIIRRNDRILDFSPRLLQYSISQEYISNISPNGMRLRNIFAAEALKDFDHELKPKILIYGGGLAHWFGNRLLGSTFKKSLIPLLQSSGHSVVPIVCDGTKDGKSHLESNLPDTARSAFGRSVAVTGMDQQTFRSTTLGEIAHITELFRASGAYDLLHELDHPAPLPLAACG